MDPEANEGQNAEEGVNPAGTEPDSPPTGDTEGQGEDQPQDSGRQILPWLIDIVLVIAAAFVIALLVQAFVVKPFTVHQESMRPTLIDGDRILISRLTYHFRSPRAGDVVVLRSPISSREDLVKRVVAVGGDTVAIHDGALYVNGVRKTEPYILDQYIRGEYPSTKIAKGQVFVLGDNRNNSADSRYFGPVSTKMIIGKAFAIYWPPTHWKIL